jgi:hypothetical protein
MFFRWLWRPSYICHRRKDANAMAKRLGEAIFLAACAAALVVGGMMVITGFQGDNAPRVFLGIGMAALIGLVGRVLLYLLTGR